LMKKLKKSGRKQATPKSPTSKLAIQAWSDSAYPSLESLAKELDATVTRIHPHFLGWN
jgi:hypothetical protein